MKMKKQNSFVSWCGQHKTHWNATVGSLLMRKILEGYVVGNKKRRWWKDSRKR